MLQDSPFERLGSHSYRIDGDTVYLVARGSLTLEDMRILLATYARIKRDHQCLFIFYDAREGTGIDKNAREYAASQPSSNQEANLQVAFGISFGLRVLINMMVRAQKALKRRVVEFHAFDAEAEARIFFEAERERIRQEKRTNGSISPPLCNIEPPSNSRDNSWGAP